MRAQASLEYLATYGWVLLVMIVTVGALAAFGIIDPSRLIPSSCEIDGGILCKEAKLTESSLILVLYNGLSHDLTEVEVNVDSYMCNATIQLRSFPYQSDTGQLVFCGGAEMPSRLKGAITVSYKQSGETVSHSVSGRFTLRRE